MFSLSSFFVPPFVPFSHFFLRKDGQATPTRTRRQQEAPADPDRHRRGVNCTSSFFCFDSMFGFALIESNAFTLSTSTSSFSPSCFRSRHSHLFSPRLVPQSRQFAFAFARFINPSAPKALGRHFIGFALAAAVASLALLALKRHAEPVIDARTGALLDAGGDLTEVGGTTSTFHDAIYVSSAALLLGARYDAALLLLFLFPLYGGFVFWKSVLAPFIFTPTAAEAAASRESSRGRGAVPRGGKQKQRVVRRG